MREATPCPPSNELTPATTSIPKPELTPADASVAVTTPTPTPTPTPTSAPTPTSTSISAPAATPATPHLMCVRKRSGVLEPVDVTKIVERVSSLCQGLQQVDPLRVSTKAISGLYDGAPTKELDALCIRTAALLIGEEPEYSQLAARLLNTYIEEEVRGQKISTFFKSISVGYKEKLISKKVYDFVSKNKTPLSAAIEPYKTALFDYFGLRTVYDRYLLKNPKTRDVMETPQYFFMRVACGLSDSVEEALHFYRLISAQDYMPSTPTLFNSGTTHPQMSSCYLLDSPEDNLDSIYDKYKDIALLSKYAGGIGLAYHRIRSKGSLIKGTNGHSNGIIPWLKTLDSSVSAVNQGGKRKGACCVYLETWHEDILDFLELRDNTGDQAKRAYNLNLANWVPDLFMQRVEQNSLWSLFDPKAVPQFTDLYGEDFAQAYKEAENQNLYTRQIKARELYHRMIKTLAETGNGWMTFKDSSNLKSNQTAPLFETSPTDPADPIQRRKREQEQKKRHGPFIFPTSALKSWKSPLQKKPPSVIWVLSISAIMSPLKAPLILKSSVKQ